ncbi:unnamed protein product [Heterobilharzia americana]|nr:unnamed protein product [Heterobilharzia americana]
MSKEFRPSDEEELTHEKEESPLLLYNIMLQSINIGEKEYLSINEYQHFTVDTKVPVSIVQHELNNENHSKNQAIINETVNVVDKSSVKPQNHIIDQTYKLTKMKEEDAKSENPFIKQSIQTLPQMIQQHLYHVENTGEQNQCSHNNQYNGSELYCNDCRNKRKRGNYNIQLEKLISNTRKTSAQNLHCTLSIDDGTSEQNSTELDEESKDIHLAQQLTTDMINKVISRLLYDYIKIS